jgi:hypothetical protein
MIGFNFKFIGIILYFWVQHLSLQAQSVLQTGTVRFSFTNLATKDTGSQIICFKPGFGASVAIKDKSSPGFRSIYEFATDSVYHFLVSNKFISVPAMSIQQQLAASHTKYSYKVTIGNEKKKILGYECFSFVAEASSGKDNTVIRGWATKQIQTPMGIIMDPDLLSVGFILEFTISDKNASTKKFFAFSAVRLAPEVDERIFKYQK